MAKSLVIVESPAKAKTIGKYLGKQFVVKASLGHVKDLPKKDLAVDVEHEFTPRYEVIEGKKKLIAELKQAAKGMDSIYLAADPDREGEAICWHLKEELESKKSDKPAIFRVMFNEITANAVKKAFDKPMAVNINLVDAQQARRVLDRLVGYKISPLLWDKVRRGLSAGRVQTVALRLIVDREREIKAFLKQEYWTIDVSLNAKKPPLLTARLNKVADKTPEVTNEAAASAIVADVDGASYLVRSVNTREKKRNPVPRFHHFYSAAGIVAQTALQCEANHDAGARPLRRQGDRQRRIHRPHHLYAYRFHACLGRRAGGSSRHDHRALWRGVSAGCAQRL